MDLIPFLAVLTSTVMVLGCVDRSPYVSKIPAKQDQPPQEAQKAVPETLGDIAVPVVVVPADELEPNDEATETVEARETSEPEIIQETTPIETLGTVVVATEGSPNTIATNSNQETPKTPAALSLSKTSHNFGVSWIGVPTNALEITLRHQGELVATQLTFSGLTGTQFSMIDTSISGSCSNELAGGSCKIRVRHNSTIVGEATATLHITYFDGYEVQSMDVALSGNTKSITQVRLSFFPCALTQDGLIYCVGSGGWSGTTTNAILPSVVANVPNVMDFTISSFHGCSISGGLAYCWGQTLLGNGTNDPSNIPVQVSNLTQVTAVTVGWTHSCAIANGLAYCWGGNLDIELGNGTLDPSNIPVQVPNLTNVTKISSMLHHTCVIANGSPYCWGRNFNGQVGNGTIDSNSSTAATWQNKTPQPVSGLGTVSDISAGWSHSCAISNGLAYCWGLNTDGELGNGEFGSGTTQRKLTPVQVLNLTNVTKISAGNEHSCAISNGLVYCWGFNHKGQLGDGTTESRNTPVPVLNLTNVTDIFVGYYQACAVSGGRAYCWGDSPLGDGTSTASATRVLFAKPL